MDNNIPIPAGKLSRQPRCALSLLIPIILLVAMPLLTTAEDVPVIASPPSSSSRGWSDAFEEESGKLNIATTVAPISSIVRNIGGSQINLRGIVPDGTNSHTFEPAPSDARILAQADLLIANGLGLEDPTIALAEANLKQGAEVFALGDLTISPDQYAYDFSFPEEGGDPNPHLWTNVPYAMRYAELVAGKLQERDPVNADYYRENLDRYLALLERLDEGTMIAVRTIPEADRKLLTYHDSWAYFAQHYDMTVLGAVQPADFSEPSPREVAELIDQISAEDVPAVFGSEVFPSDVLEQIADESGSRYINELRDDDPPGDPGDPDHTYVGMMLYNVEVMVTALGGDTQALDDIPPYDTYLP